jgi:hypothetical protein
LDRRYEMTKKRMWRGLPVKDEKALRSTPNDLPPEHAYDEKVRKVTDRPRGTRIPYGWRLVKDDEILRRKTDFTRLVRRRHPTNIPMPWERVEGLAKWTGYETYASGWDAIRKMTKSEIKDQAEDARRAKNAKARDAYARRRAAREIDQAIQAMSYLT